jgi:hypothetical protein
MFTNDSEEHPASIFMGKQPCEQSVLLATAHTLVLKMDV